MIQINGDYPPSRGGEGFTTISGRDPPTPPGVHQEPWFPAMSVDSPSAPQAAQWAESFDGLGCPASVQPVAVGGQIAFGNSLAFNAWVLKANANGEVSWEKTFDGMIGGAVDPTA